MANNPGSPNAVLLRAEDNVAVCCSDLPAGTSLPLGGKEVVLLDKVPLGHKVSVEIIARGEAVLKYGQVIGFASSEIHPAGPYLYPTIKINT